MSLFHLAVVASAFCFLIQIALIILNTQQLCCVGALPQFDFRMQI